MRSFAKWRIRARRSAGRLSSRTWARLRGKFAQRLCPLIMELLRDYFGPDAADSVYQGVARFLRRESAPQAMGEYLARFDSLCRKAEPKVQRGGACPEVAASAIRLQNASLLRSEITGTGQYVGDLGNFFCHPGGCIDFMGCVEARRDRIFRRRQMWMWIRMTAMILPHRR